MGRRTCAGPGVAKSAFLAVISPGALSLPPPPPQIADAARGSAALAFIASSKALCIDPGERGSHAAAANEGDVVDEIESIGAATSS